VYVDCFIIYLENMYAGCINVIFFLFRISSIYLYVPRYLLGTKLMSHEKKCSDHLQNCCTLGSKYVSVQTIKLIFYTYIKMIY
jgi:hypothetical protein